MACATCQDLLPRGVGCNIFVAFGRIAARTAVVWRHQRHDLQSREFYFTVAPFVNRGQFMRLVCRDGPRATQNRWLNR